jgi:hypothetical protein
MERYRRFWATTFDRLDAALAAFQSQQATSTDEEMKEQPND